jgi:uncharacterized protein DUF4365
MDLNKQKEQFSIAYVRAVVAAAGYNVYKMEVDEDSVDLGIAATASSDLPLRPRLDLQLKCTAAEAALHDEFIHFPLKVKNYSDLRNSGLVPQALVVVLVPTEVQDWLTQTEEQLFLRRCGYWLSLLGEPAVDNTESVTVRIPRAQQFTPLALQDMMRRINDGENQ